MISETMPTVTSPIKVLIADDHPLFREALRKLLETQAAEGWKGRIDELR